MTRIRTAAGHSLSGVAPAGETVQDEQLLLEQKILRDHRAHATGATQRRGHEENWEFETHRALDCGEQIEGGGRIITRRLGQRVDTDHAGLIDAKMELPPATPATSPYGSSHSVSGLATRRALLYAMSSVSTVDAR